MVIRSWPRAAVTALLFAGPCVSLGAQPLPSTAASQSVRVRLMPPLVDLTVDSARIVLRLFGIQPLVTTSPVAESAVGRVVRQFPEPRAALRPDSTVLTVGRSRVSKWVLGTLELTPPAAEVAPQTTPVPPLAGLDSTQWPAVLRKASLVAGEITRVESASQPAGRVIESKPREGKQVPRGTPITLIVSIGPAEAPPAQKPDTGLVPSVIDTLQPIVLVAMPTVVGATAQQALAVLTSVGFDLVTFVGASTPGATVAAQLPVSGDSVPAGSRVTLSMLAPPLRTIPSLVGLARDKADAVAGAFDFATRLIATRRGLRLSAVVDSQFPAPGVRPADPATDTNVISIWLIEPIVPPLVPLGVVLATVLFVFLKRAPIPPRVSTSGEPDHGDTQPPAPTFDARASLGGAPQVSISREASTIAGPRLEIRFSTTLRAPTIDCEAHSILRDMRWSDE